MPRLNFNGVEEFVFWLKTRDLSKYDFYRTSEKIVIAAPSRSTQPLMYGTVQQFTEKDGKILFDFLGKNKKTIFEVEHFEWDSTKMPGVERSYLNKE